jgi:CYTH domain-containing protein
MDKTAKTELHRLFLVESLPEPLTPASAHLQIFDTYIPHTRLRVRQMRDPLTNHWTRMLQQRFCAADGDHAITKLVEMHLNDDEFAIFERVRGAETRKNRYFHEFDRREVIFDVYLGALRGLITAKVEFKERETMLDMLDYEPLPFMKIEITEEDFFEPQTLAGKSSAEVADEVARLGANILPAAVGDE